MKTPCYENSNKYLRNENVEKIFRMFNKIINNDPGALSKKYLKNLFKDLIERTFMNTGFVLY